MTRLAFAQVRGLTKEQRYAVSGRRAWVDPRLRPPAAPGQALPPPQVRHASAPLRAPAQGPPGKVSHVTTAPASRARRRAAVLTAAVAALGLSACSVNSPATTLNRYAPADGVELDGESVDVRDLLVISQGGGAPGVVLGSVVNRTSEPVTVTVSAAGNELSPQVEVGPGSVVRLDGQGGDGSGEPVTIPALDAPAGQSIEIRIATEQETLIRDAPVLLPRGHYEQFADDAGGTVEPRPDEDDDH